MNGRILFLAATRQPLILTLWGSKIKKGSPSWGTGEPLHETNFWAIWERSSWRAARFSGDTPLIGLLGNLFTANAPSGFDQELVRAASMVLKATQARMGHRYRQLGFRCIHSAPRHGLRCAGAHVFVGFRAAGRQRTRRSDGPVTEIWKSEVSCAVMQALRIRFRA
jgi:hypothetical protein